MLFVGVAELDNKLHKTYFVLIKSREFVPVDHLEQCIDGIYGHGHHEPEVFRYRYLTINGYNFVPPLVGSDFSFQYVLILSVK